MNYLQDRILFAIHGNVKKVHVFVFLSWFQSLITLILVVGLVVRS